MGFIRVDDAAFDGDVITDIECSGAADVDLAISIGSSVAISVTFAAAGISGNPKACALTTTCWSITPNSGAWAWVITTSITLLGDATDIEVIVRLE